MQVGTDTAAPRLSASQFIPHVYAELRAIAGARVDSERANHTLPPTALVDEAFLKVVGPKSPRRLPTPDAQQLTLSELVAGAPLSVKSGRPPSLAAARRPEKPLRPPGEEAHAN